MPSTSRVGREASADGLLVVTGARRRDFRATLACVGYSSAPALFGVVPIVGVLSSWLLFGERIDGIEALAGVAVVGGVLIGSLPLRFRRRTPEPADVKDERPDPSAGIPQTATRAAPLR